jgi:hypothetical protein
MTDVVYWLEIMFGEDTSTFYGFALFHAVFNEMKELDALSRMKISEKSYKERLMQDIIDRESLPEVKDIEADLKLMLIEEIQNKKFKKGTVFTAPETFHYFALGRSQSFGDRSWSVRFANCWAYRWLFSGDEEWRFTFGYVLAQACEILCYTMLSDLERGTFYEASHKDVGWAVRPQLVYGIVKHEMREIDGRRIMAGLSPMFNLPIYGV